VSGFEVGILGNPNSGKTTLFNALTGSHQRVGNWPGVTVEQKTGAFKLKEHKVKVVDLPGTYSLVVPSQELSLDERIACDYILEGKADAIVNVIDSSNLERNLYLTLQLLEMGIPVIVALNMMDVAKQKRLSVDVDALSKYLSCPVVPLEAVKKRGVTALKEAIVIQTQTHYEPHLPFAYRAPVERAINEIISGGLQDRERMQVRWQVIHMLEGDSLLCRDMPESVTQAVIDWQGKLLNELDHEADIVIADARYEFIGDLVNACVTRAPSKRGHVTQLIDNIVLNRFLGIPIFFAMMYCMFLFAINIGGAFQDFFDIASDGLFVQAPVQLMQQWHVPPWLIAIIAQGIGKGINTVLTFIPVICGMFLFLSFLEQSGYMSRAAFVVDRLMRAVGLPGKSFVPMIVGFGCNVPAVMATRTLENRRDRILTVMMSPFMSCGARLAIFAVFTAAFFPQGGTNIVFALYFIGIVIAVLTGVILRRTILKGDPAPFVLELPTYHMPNIKSLWLHTWHRLRGFVIKAGKLIIPICILLGVLNSLSLHGGLAADGSETSLLALFGRLFTPLFAPIGIHQDNWPATVGLLSGVLAKEVVVGTLNSLYSHMGHLALTIEQFQLLPTLKAAVMTIPVNLLGLGQALLNPLLASAPEHGMSTNVMGQMYQRFDGQIGAFAYLLFVLLYFPCVSTIAAMARELGKAWAWFSVAWTTVVAYGVATFFYQAATMPEHILSSSIWLIAIVFSSALFFTGLKIFAQKEVVSSGSSSSNPSGGVSSVRKCCKHL
jgi:ferrous iron transport protein B